MTQDQEGSEEDIQDIQEKVGNKEELVKSLTFPKLYLSDQIDLEMSKKQFVYRSQQEDFAKALDNESRGKRYI